MRTKNCSKPIIMMKKENHSQLCLKDFVVLYMNMSSINGLRYLVSPSLNRIEKFFWSIAISLSVIGAGSISFSTWTRFQNNPTVVSMERNYNDWNTTMPSITICPIPRYNEQKLEKIIYENFTRIQNKDVVINFIKELANATHGNFRVIKTLTDEIQPLSYWKIISKIVNKFQHKVANSNPDLFYKRDFEPVITEVGLCYSYNSIATIYNNPRVWDENNWKYINGLKVLEGSPLDGDIFVQVVDMNMDYQIYILDPTEFPEISIPQLNGFNGSMKNLELTALTITTSKEVESLSIEQRKCRLPHESNLKTSPAYSYNLCRMECRMKESYRLCKCVPFFYRPTGAYPVCDIKGMQCLDNYAERLIRLIDPKTNHKIPCNCLQLCNEVKYVVDNDNTMSWPFGTNIRWGLIKYPKFRLKRNILFGKIDLLVAVGGTAGLFLGLSMLSCAEFIYFFTLRLFWFVLRRDNFKELSQKLF